MTVFLTSHTGGWKTVGKMRMPTTLFADNNLLGELSARWKPDARLLFVASDPEGHEKNDSIRDALVVSFPISGLSVSDITVCDSRNESIATRVKDFDCIILSGGHVPTQNAFFRKIGLKEALAGYEGIIIGISAGSMNCAGTVYAHPELPGEAESYLYERFLPGLDLTRIMILPHYQLIRYDELDGLRVIEDIACPDSDGRDFYCLPDGSYIIVEDGISTLCGEAWRIRDGEIEKISEANQRVVLIEK